jgi:hypothetical protein
MGKIGQPSTNDMMDRWFNNHLNQQNKLMWGDLVVAAQEF